MAARGDSAGHKHSASPGQPRGPAPAVRRKEGAGGGAVGEGSAFPQLCACCCGGGREAGEDAWAAATSDELRRKGTGTPRLACFSVVRRRPRPPRPPLGPQAQGPPAR
ncbi:hypothetical protein J1605_022428 [Eschrichtius robustus]|uniref:Uncharacterized protein n=1 Tax=Eschrichtius robustus TaxID=9764 RepID=A0AB34HBM6_ESCRO|nr:hypothetical protein J1605_022428 [Eschrichtius robustus]